MSASGLAHPATAEPMENGTAAEHTEEQAAAKDAPAGLPRVQTETAAFSTPEKDQLSSPHLIAATKEQVLSSRSTLTACHPHPNVKPWPLHSPYSPLPSLHILPQRTLVTPAAQ